MSWSNVTTQADPKDLRNLISNVTQYYTIYNDDGTRKWIWNVTMKNLTSNSFYLDYKNLPSDNDHKLSTYRLRIVPNTSKFTQSEVVSNLSVLKSVTMKRKRYAQATTWDYVATCPLSSVSASGTGVLLNLTRAGGDIASMRQHDENVIFVFNF